MSIADKLTTIAENEQKVYDAGKKSQYDEFWDSFQDKGKRTDYNMAFSGLGWTDTTFKPKYKIKIIESAHRLFQGSRITDLTECGVEVDFSECQQMQMTFYHTKFKKLGVINVKSTTTLANTFAYSLDLETIEELIIQNDGTTPISINTFEYCVQLRNLIVNGKLGKSVSLKWSPNLTHESLISIINALKDYSGTTSTYTLTLHADAKAKLTEADIAIITQKGWTLA